MTKSSAWFACGAASLVALAVLSPRAIPYNMDEFVHYQALGCASAPLQRGLPAFRDGCGLYDLRLPFTSERLPLRSYLYIGSFPAVPFFPFWRAIGGPLAGRVQGAAFFLAWAVLATRLLRVRRASLVLAALLLPGFLGTFLVDEGPVGLAALLFTGALLLIRRSLARSGAVAFGWGALAGVLLFLGIWSKLVFACLLPAVAAFTIYEGRRRFGSWAGLARQARLAVAACALAASVPTLVLLASTDVDGRPYLEVLQRGRISPGPAEVGLRLLHLVREAADPQELAPRNVVLSRSPLDGLPGLFAIVALVAGVRASRVRREITGWAALSVATLALLSLSAYSQWPHHAFHGLLLFVLALALALDAIGRRARVAVAVGAVVCWATLGVRLGHGAYPVEAAPDKDALLRFVRTSGLDRRTLQVHTSWGTYYVAQLFGDEARLVVYLRALSEDPVQLAQVRELARERGRPLLLIGSRRWDRFQTPLVASIVGEPAHRWRFGEWWAAEYPVSAGSARSASLRP